MKLTTETAVIFDPSRAGTLPITNPSNNTAFEPSLENSEGKPLCPQPCAKLYKSDFIRYKKDAVSRETAL
jgi:hypothetical protein